MPDKRKEIPITADRILRSLGASGRYTGFDYAIYIDALNEIAGRVLTHAPSNAEFIDMIAAYIKNGGRHENPMERLAHRRLFAFDK